MSFEAGSRMVRKETGKTRSVCPACKSDCDQFEFAVADFVTALKLYDEFKCSSCGFQRPVAIDFSGSEEETLAKLLYVLCWMAAEAREKSTLGCDTCLVMFIAVCWPPILAAVVDILGENGILPQYSPPGGIWTVAAIFLFYLIGLLVGLFYIVEKPESRRKKTVFLPLMNRIKAAYPNWKTVAQRARLLAAEQCEADGVPWYAPLDKWLT